MRNVILLVLSLGAILVVALYMAYESWVGASGVEVTIHGYLALVLGVIATLAVGGGLMALSFYSSRKGYDDNVMNFLDKDESC